MTPASTVLVVDDTPANLSLLLDAIGGAGHRVLIAESGGQALELLEKVRPDLILLDVCMPGMDGFATCSAIKAKPEWREIPVLFTTAVHEPAEKVRAFSVGAYDYITKPVYPPEVLARIQTHLQLRRLQVALEEKNLELEREVAVRTDAEVQLAKSLEVALVVWRQGRAVFVSELAKSLLSRVASGTGGGGGEPALAQLAAGLRVEGLSARVLTEKSGGEVKVLLLEDEERRPGPAKLASLGLSPRQAEVLFWMSEGKTNGEIAIIIAASPRTIEKHAEMIFQKLGVSSRTAAMLQAIEVLRKP